MFQTKHIAFALAVAAFGVLMSGLQADAAGRGGNGGGGIKKIAPMTQTSRQVSTQSTGAAGLKKRRCRYVSTPYPHLECTF